MSAKRNSGLSDDMKARFQFQPLIDEDEVKPESGNDRITENPNQVIPDEVINPIPETVNQFLPESTNNVLPEYQNNLITEKPNNLKTEQVNQLKPKSGKSVKTHSGKKVKPESGNDRKPHATFYFDSEDDLYKLDDLALQYSRKTGDKINRQDIIKQFVSKLDYKALLELMA